MRYVCMPYMRRTRLAGPRGTTSSPGPRTGTGQTGTWPNGYLVFFSRAVLRCVLIVKF